MKIKPTSYSIKSDNRGNEERGPWLKKWKLSGSVNGNDWTELDKVLDDSDLMKGPNEIASRKITMANVGEYQFFRLQQIGPNWRGDKFFVLQAWEIYGTLIKSLQ
jgi:hypothetical protein